MPLLAPFRAWRYDFRRVGPPEAVLAPPYDVISADEARAMAASNEHHVIHLILGKPPPGEHFPSKVYACAARHWHAWRSEGVLVQDDEASLYSYECAFDDLLTGERVTRHGIVGALELSPFEDGRVRPHEEVFRGPLSDRFRLLEAADANFSQILALYDAPADSATRASSAEGEKPLIECTDPMGVVHRVRRLDPAATTEAVAALADCPVYIADGHHRYTAALEHARRRGRLGTDQPGARVLVCLVNIRDPGLRAYGTHRLYSLPSGTPDLDPLSRFARLQPLEVATGAEAISALHALGEGVAAYVFVVRGRIVLAVAEDTAPLARLIPEVHEVLRREPLTLLHEVLLRQGLGLGGGDLDAVGGVSHTRDADEAVELVRSERYDLAVLVQAPSMATLVEVCGAGQRMPHKATYFYPKLLSGILMYDMSAA